jgi:hypothetical protein
MSSGMRNDPLAGPLKRAAERARPEFSEPLHARVMRSVNAAHASHADAAILRPRAPVRIAWIATAAALLIAVGLAWRFLREAPGPVAPAGPRTLPVVADLLTGAADPMRDQLRQQLDETRLAYLDRDAQHFANFVLEQVDVGVPAAPDHP